MRVTTMIRQRQAERLGQLGEVRSEVPISRVASADLGKQAQRLDQAWVDGRREQQDGRQGSGQGGRPLGFRS